MSTPAEDALVVPVAVAVSPARLAELPVSTARTVVKVTEVPTPAFLVALTRLTNQIHKASSLNEFISHLYQDK